MLKIIGACFVVIATSMWGINAYRQMKLKAEVTNGCIKGLFCLKENIRFSMENLRECLILCSKSAGKSEEIFKLTALQIGKGINPSDALKSAVSSSDTMGESTKNIMYSLCGQLGKTDAEGQILILEKCMSELETVYKDEIENVKVKGILYQKCGIIAGILLTIILI